MAASGSNSTAATPAVVGYVDEYELLPRSSGSQRRHRSAGRIRQHAPQRVLSMGNQHKMAGRVAVASGALLQRHEARRLVFRAGSRCMPQFAVEPSISLAWVRLPYGDFAARLLASRFTYTPTPRLFVSSLIQFNMDAHTLNSSVRLRWEYCRAASCSGLQRRPRHARAWQ